MLLNGFLALLIVALVHAAMLAPIVPISDALATTASQASQSEHGRRFEYGWLRGIRLRRVRHWHDTRRLGVGESRSGKHALAAAGAVLAIGGAASLWLPKLPAPGPVSRFPGSIVRDWAHLLRIAIYRRVLIVAALIEGSHALHDAFSVIRWHDAGIDLPIIGILWSESVLSEVLVFLLIGPRLLRLLSPGGACALAAAAGAVRWTIVAFTTSPFALGLVQPLHGLTFALLHLACMRLIVWAVPVRLAASAQAIYGTLCIGAATALLTLVSGMLYEVMGGHAFLVMAALCLLALPMCPGLRMPELQATHQPAPGQSHLATPRLSIAVIPAKALQGSHNAIA